MTSSLANWAGAQSAGSTTASTGTSGTTSNNGTVTLPAPTANWGIVGAVEIRDRLTSGNLLYVGVLTTPKTVNNGDPAPAYAAGSLTFQVDN